MTGPRSTQSDSRYQEFIEALTAKLQAAGVPAMPSWPDAIDWLIEKARREWCGLCGGYGAINEFTNEPVPCMACGKKSDGMVLVVVSPYERAEPGEQKAGLRVLKGGRP